MKRKAVAAILVAVMMVISAVTVFATVNGDYENGNSVTARFFVVEDDAAYEFSMTSEDGELTIYITNDTPVNFEEPVPLCDDCEEVTTDAREVLFDRTLAEVLDSRKLTVVFEEDELVSVTILFEIAVHLPQDINGYEDGYEGITTLPGEIDWDYFELDPITLNGEVVVNNEILEGAPLPFVLETKDGEIVMVPLRAVATALGYPVYWNDELQSVQLGVATHLWIGSTEVHLGRMAPIEISTAPVLIEWTTFVPLDFFRSVLNQTAYVFEGQVVIETYSDMY